MKETPYWMDLDTGSEDYGNRSLPLKTDVLIIGGGYTGLNAALILRRSGIEVTVIDKQNIGGDASSKNGGMALSGLSGDIHRLMEQFGKETMQRFFRESVESVNCVERLVCENNIDCHFTRSGHVEAAAKPSHVEVLKREQEFYRNYLNHNTQLLGSEKMRSEIASTFYYGGLVDPSGAGLQPAKYAAGLTKMVADSGAGLYSFVEARTYARRGSRYYVNTSKGDIVAEKLIVTTNGHTQTFSPWLKRRIIPFDSYMIATEKLSPKFAQSLIPKNRMFSDTKNILYYFRLSPDQRRLLFGGRAKIASAPVRQVAPILYKYMLGVFPQLKECRIEYAWSGRVCFTFDRFPHLGRHDGVYYAAGYCGHGVAMATYFGQKIAEMILDSGNPTIFTAKKFRTMPFYSGKPWFLPVVQLCYKLMDRLP